jgi:hypothetical protein
MPPKVAALPPEHIQHAVQEAGLSGQDIRAILRAPEWHSQNSRHEVPETYKILEAFVGLTVSG